MTTAPDWNTTPASAIPSSLNLPVWFADHTPPPAHVLDIGCGSGAHTLDLARRGYTLSACDPSRDAIAHLTRNAREARLNIDARVLDDPRTLPFARHTFDAALLIAVLTVIPSDDDALQLIRAAATSLKPGATLYVCDFAQNWTSPLDRDRYLAAQRATQHAAQPPPLGTFNASRRDGTPMLARHRAPADFIRLLHAANLRIMKSESPPVRTQTGRLVTGFS